MRSGVSIKVSARRAELSEWGETRRGEDRRLGRLIRIDPPQKNSETFICSVPSVRSDPPGEGAQSEDAIKSSLSVLRLLLSSGLYRNNNNLKKKKKRQERFGSDAGGSRLCGG